MSGATVLLPSWPETYAWMTTNSVNLSGCLMLAVFVLVFVCSHVNDNYSWVDRTWSIVPVVYAWIHAAYAARDPSHSSSAWLTKNSVFTGIITVWGVRLTLNFYRRGGYFRGGEDYRWNHVRTWPILRSVRCVWVLFNLLIISLFQTVLLWAITLPLCAIPATPMTARDWVFAGFILACIALEAKCDNEQWRFQTRKRQPAAVRQDPSLRFGFCVTGLFGYSRHMNVACESSIWIGLAVAGCSQQWSWLPWWQMAGCVALQVLTIFSTGVITERLTSDKYPLYAVYQATTPMLWPTPYSTTSRTLFLLNRAAHGEQEE